MGTLVISIIRRAGHWWQSLARAPRPPRSPIGPRTLPAYAALARYHLGATELEPRLRLLVSQLAAERSACGWCIQHGRHLWREAQLPTALLPALEDYEANPLFSPRERVALGFADALTRYTASAGGMPEAPLTAVRQHFSEPEVAALTETVAAMHFFNPITGALGADATQPAPRARAVRNPWL